MRGGSDHMTVLCSSTLQELWVVKIQKYHFHSLNILFTEHEKLENDYENMKNGSKSVNAE